VSRHDLVRLQDIAEVITGSTPPTNNPVYYGGSIPFVTPVELDQDVPITKSKIYLTSEGAERSRQLPPEAILVCCIGSIGKVGISGTNVVTNQQINALVLDRKKAYSRYVLHACRQLKPILETIAPSTTVKIVNKSRFSGLTIPLPPLDEQRRIAIILDKADALRRKRRAAIQKLDSLTQSIFLELFGDPATNPKLWPLTTLGEVVAEFRYGTSNKSSNLGKPALRIPNVVGGTLNLEDLKTVPVEDGEFQRLRLSDQDLLLVRTNGNKEYVGRCALFDGKLAVTSGFLPKDFIYASYLIRARMRAGSVEPEFIRDYLLGSEGRRQLLARSKTSAGQFNINTEGLSKIPVPLPPLELQKQYVRRTRRVSEMKGKFSAAEAACLNVSQSLQSRAFRGEL
jgi:type I restriction enzyme, S subunit